MPACRYVPHRAAAPLVDLDEGQLNYVLIKAVSPPLLPPSPSAAEEAGGAAVPTEVVTLVRGFTKRECVALPIPGAPRGSPRSVSVATPPRARRRPSRSLATSDRRARAPLARPPQVPAPRRRARGGG